jgi:hypothetical protein
MGQDIRMIMSLWRKLVMFGITTSADLSERTLTRHWLYSDAAEESRQRRRVCWDLGSGTTMRLSCIGTSE